MFDEPMNGLDLDGVRWIRGLLRQLADEGRAVLFSSPVTAQSITPVTHGAADDVSTGRVFARTFVLLDWLRLTRDDASR
jgi:hypothetical protein